MLILFENKKLYIQKFIEEFETFVQIISNIIIIEVYIKLLIKMKFLNISLKFFKTY